MVVGESLERVNVLCTCVINKFCEIETQHPLWVYLWWTCSAGSRSNVVWQFLFCRLTALQTVMFYVSFLSLFVNLNLWHFMCMLYVMIKDKTWANTKAN